MTAIILTVHTMIVIALVGVVLLQRSEGGALGMGGGGGGMMSSRGAATALTRTTTVLAALFFASSLTLALVADRGEIDADFVPISGEPAEDDFSDFIGTGEEGDDALETLPETQDEDVFTLPEDLGTGEGQPPAEEPASEDDGEPQR
jgi:preprotein translocase subunit SecG